MENKELLEKAKQANSPEELLALAKENDYDLDEEGAKAYFEQLHKTGELSDDELDNVAGGGCYNGDRLVVTLYNQCYEWVCKKCGRGMPKRVYKTIFMSFDHDCLNGTIKMNNICKDCKYCSYEKGLWLCNNPAKMKK